RVSRTDETAASGHCEWADAGITMKATHPELVRLAPESLMKARSPARWLAALSVVVLVVPCSVSAAELHVMISAGFYRVYAELGPAFERASGHRLLTTRGPSIGDSPEAIP